jgi:glycosyltransferase involved in cell wall biosynthesis
VEPRRYRLAAVTSHPVQYQAPLFQRLAADGRIDLTVFYGHDGSIVGEADRDFGIPIAWDRSLLDGYSWIFLRRTADRRDAIHRLASEARIIGHLRRGRFDAVFIHSYATRLSLLAYVGALTSSTPVLLRTESERLRKRHRWVEALKYGCLRPLFAGTSAFLVIGVANRLFFEHYGVDASRQFFTPYAVDNGYFGQQRGQLQDSRPLLRHGYGFPDDVVVVGFSGKLIPRKGVDDLLEAIATLQRDGLRIGALIVGEGGDRAQVEASVRARGLGWIVFAGFKNQSKLASCYVCMDLFALPSRFDTWGLVVNEAMLFGLPVIASTHVGAALDLIEHGHNGYIYPAGDVDGLTEALRRLVRSPDRRCQFGRRSSEIVQRYSYDACVRGILEALEYVGTTAGATKT